jgi:hypothetical protein
MFMKKQDAIEMQQHGLRAMEQLSDLLNIASDRCSAEEFELIKRGVALSLGKILIDVLQVIYQEHPEIDHLRETPLTVEQLNGSTH